MRRIIITNDLKSRLINELKKRLKGPTVAVVNKTKTQEKRQKYEKKINNYSKSSISFPKKEQRVQISII